MRARVNQDPSPDKRPGMIALKPRLKAQGVAVRIGSHSGEPPFDWDDRGTWEPALRGVSDEGAWSRSIAA